MTAQEHAYKCQHETILADLNRYMATMRLVRQADEVQWVSKFLKFSTG